jgi:hypothetical protein
MERREGGLYVAYVGWVLFHSILLVDVAWASVLFGPEMGLQTRGGREGGSLGLLCYFFPGFAFVAYDITLSFCLLCLTPPRSISQSPLMACVSIIKCRMAHVDVL